MRLILSLLLIGTLPGLAGEFINPTFDDPDLSGPLTPIYPGGPLEGNTSQLLRGWTATADGLPVATMTYAPYPVSSGGGPFDLVGNPPDQASGGANSLWMISRLPLAPELRLQQTGSVPIDAAGLWIFSAGFSLQMSINGERVDDPRIGTLTDPVIDISEYAGQTVNLEFLVPSGGVAGAQVRFDIKGWVSVPEPSNWALLGLGLAALVWRVRRQR